jgi:ubiquinone/menaquinone biosynthesis C-methylase UbiE
MAAADQGQVSRSAAEIYEEFFVPALFREPARHIAQRSDIASGQSVLDVACGTGVLARETAALAGPGHVTGLDRNEGMLAVARRLSPDIAWRLGLAEALPFDDGSFDRVLSQFGLKFFDDRTAALKQMRRVGKPGGAMLVAVWDRLEHSPGYAAMAGLLGRLFGSTVADALHAPFSLGDLDTLRATFADAGLHDAEIESFDVTARFPSLDAWVHTDIRGWTLAEMIDDDQFRTLLAAARTELARFEASDGSVRFSAPAHLVRLAID